MDTSLRHSEWSAAASEDPLPVRDEVPKALAKSTFFDDTLLIPLRVTTAAGLFASSVLLVVLCALTGCRSTLPPKPLEQLTPAEQAGHTAFTARCGACHYDRESGSLHGPSLLGVYQKPYLPSGAPANDERIRNTILHGRGNMPALGGALGDDEITGILLYLKTL